VSISVDDNGPPTVTSSIRSLGSHTDDHGQTCPHHAPAPPDVLLTLAAIGSRASGFNHDIASKLQGLMMALDEIGELAETVGDPSTSSQLMSANENAQGCLKDVLAILNVNRAMTKPPMRAPVALTELVARAGERIYITLKGSIPDVDISVSAPTTIHALSLLFDIAGGPGRGRTIPVDVSQSAKHVTLSLPIAGTQPATSEHVALASFILARDGGSLRCANNGQQFVIELPLA